MSKVLILAAFVSSGLSLSCAVTESPPNHSFAQGLILKFEAAPEEESPDEIWSFLIGEDVVFYVAPMCCDIPGTLYDKDGNILCNFDGGMTGLGKDQCPEFHDDRSTGVLVWRDPRLDKGE